ncbi:VOC family protein [Flavobacterium sp. 3HN19-14]|uniref:VOC family protein n=1 Tax=Flavobacterium sp. 3HN19-14 TaxID=3448133 RepID=UPI003EDFC7D3
MKKTTLVTLALIATFCLGFGTSSMMHPQSLGSRSKTKIHQPQKAKDMKLGAFSLSLNVKDLKASKQFYESLGFNSFGGSLESNYLIMKNGNALIGIFHGFFEGNALTFNPGWDEDARNFDPFDDVRFIQKQLKADGIKLKEVADEKTTGPAYITLSDPDGNFILIDQHR